VDGASRTAAQSASTSSSAPSRTIGTRAKTRGIVNFGEVTPHLYRGGLPNAEGVKALQKLGVKVVVDMRGGTNKTEKDAVTSLGMEYIAIPSHCPFPTDQPYAHFLRVIRENRGRKVFVHCRLGDDRTGMAVAAYRMAEEGWSPDEAMNEMKAFGFTTLHHSICPGMSHYEHTFPKRLKNDSAFKDLDLPNKRPK